MELEEKIKKEINEAICKLIESGVDLEDYFNRKSAQMRTAWEVVRKLRKEGIKIKSLGPFISQAAKAIKSPACVRKE